MYSQFMMHGQKNIKSYFMSCMVSTPHRILFG